MSIPEPNPPEIISYLKRSNLPTVLVEGKDDFTIFRWMESKLGVREANILQCGSKSALIEVYNNRAEFSHLDTVFIADKDMWLFTAVPNEYEDIIFTRGYSIENDLYDDSRIDTLFEEKERETFSNLIENACKWFASEVENYIDSGNCNVDVHINEIIDLDGTELNDDVEFDGELFTDIFENFSIKLRGKQLFQCILRILSHPDRDPKYSKKSLFEISVKYFQEPNNLTRILSEVEDRLNS